MNYLKAFVVAAALLALAAGLRATFVSAHADYDHSTPARDAVVDVPPTVVDVFFKQDVFKQAGKNYVRVFNDGGTQVSTGDGTVDDVDRRHISADMPPNAPNGRYVVRWMTTSDEDGDTDDGAFCFYVGVQPTSAQQAECATFNEVEPTLTQGPTVAGTTPTGAAETPTPTSNGNDDNSGPNVLAIVGVVGGIVIVVAIGGGVAVWLRRQVG